MSLVCAFTVPGAPVPKARARVPRKGGAYTPERTKTAEERIGMYLKVAYPHMKPVAGPVSVALTFSMNGAQRGDWDNYSKLVCDALNGKAWVDDRQIIFATVRVHANLSAVSGGPSTRIEVYEV